MAATGFPGSSVPQFASLYVGDLHFDVTEAMLYEIFNSVGPVASIRVCRDNVTRKSLGYAYVNFHSVSDAERALDTLNYSSIKGRSCRIMWSHRDPSLRKSAVGNIFVKNLDKNIDNKALYDTFSLFGNILSCKVASDPATGKSRGYGFVHYETEEAAKQSIERVNGMQIGEKTVFVGAFQRRGERPPPEAVLNFTNIYIKNMPESWTDDSVKEAFSEFGTISSCALVTDKKGRRFAFVDYKDTGAAHAACEAMHGKDLRPANEQTPKPEDGPDPPGLLYCQRAQSKLERQAELKDKFQKDTPAEAPKKGVNLYVKNLGEDMDDDKLRALFAPFGETSSVSAKKDEQGRCKGFGFVCFTSSDSATKAVTDMHLKVVGGKPLYVGLHEKRDARMERLRQRYSPGMDGGKDGGKGFGKGFGKGGKDGGFGSKGGGGFGGFGSKGKGKDGSFGGKGWGGGYDGYGGAGMGMGMGAGMGGMGPMGAMGGMPGMPRPQGMMGGMYPNPMMGNMGMMGGKGGPNPMMMMGNMGGQMGAPGGMGAMRPGMPMGGPGMMQQRPPMPQQQMQQRPMGMQPQQAQQGMADAPLSAAALAAAPSHMQKQMLGTKLYPAVARIQPELAGKITGMMLEMDNSELLILLESDTQLRAKVDEALNVLKNTGK